MATYGVYSKNLKWCYVSGLNLIHARRHLCGRGDRVLCIEREVVSALKIEITLRKDWCWRWRPQFGCLELGFLLLYFHKQRMNKPYKVIQD